ncbi:hypothetical protein ACLOJK_014836 [Asimina triloba]
MGENTLKNYRGRESLHYEKNIDYDGYNGMLESKFCFSPPLRFPGGWKSCMWCKRKEVVRPRVHGRKGRQPSRGRGSYLEGLPTLVNGHLETICD